MIMSIMFPPSKKKLAKVQFSLDDSIREFNAASKPGLEDREMFLNSSLSAVKRFTESIEYLEKNKSKFLTDSKAQFNWKYKNENYSYVLLIDENLGVPYGYELTINGQLVQIVHAFNVRVNDFDVRYQTKDKKIDKTAEEFLNFMKAGHYIHSDIHKGILAMKSVSLEAKKFKISYFQMEIHNIEDLITSCKKQIERREVNIPSQQKERDKYYAFYLQNTEDIEKYEKEVLIKR